MIKKIIKLNCIFLILASGGNINGATLSHINLKTINITIQSNNNNIINQINRNDRNSKNDTYIEQNETVRQIHNESHPTTQHSCSYYDANPSIKKAPWCQ